MPLAPRFPCLVCKREFTNDFLIRENGEYVLSVFCESVQKVSVKLEKLDKSLETVHRRLEFVERMLGVDVGSVRESSTDH